jgi:hypothetical protein
MNTESANHERPAEEREAKRLKETVEDENEEIEDENEEKEEEHTQPSCAPRPGFEKYKKITPTIRPHKHVVLPIYFSDDVPHAYVKDGPLSETEKNVLMAILGMESCDFREKLEIMLGASLTSSMVYEDLKDLIERYYRVHRKDVGTKRFPAMDKSVMIASLDEIQKNNKLWSEIIDAQLIAAMVISPECFSMPITSCC